MRKYEHKTQYYETDQMGIIHHSNYIRWFEEARIDMMEQIGMGYAEMEAKGMIIPVLEVSCEYKKMTRFGETVVIYTKFTDFTGLKFSFEYEIKEKKSGELRCTGRTRHCFLNKEGRPMNLKKTFPDVYNLLMKEL
jgi:acyl-CoA thioester hydrolase